MINGEYYNRVDNTSTDRSDRYRDCSILEDTDTGDILLSTRSISDIPKTTEDRFHTVESQEVGRLYLISHQYYHTPLLWWVIAQANNIYDPYADMVVGSILRIPSIESLYGANGILL